MKIAYGVHGYGRGHSSRALAVLPHLTARHDVLVLAGCDAYAVLRNDYNVVRIPMIQYQHRQSGKVSNWKTLVQSIPNVLDWTLRGAGLEMVCGVLEEFGPDVVMSDSDPWTHWAARRMGLGRISFDHFGALAYCEWPMSLKDRLRCRFESAIYRWIMAGMSDRTVVVSFYRGEPRRPGVCVVGPVLREAVHKAQPERGDYLLAYMSNGHVNFTQRVINALKGLSVPVVVYGAGREGVEGNLDFRPPSNTRFVDDLARCRAVFSTAGNQLISETMHFRKPLLVLPEDSFEQRLNAAAIDRMQIGVRTSQTQVSTRQIEAFWANEPHYVESFPDVARDGQNQAVAAIERYAEELAQMKTK